MDPLKESQMSRILTQLNGWGSLLSVPLRHETRVAGGLEDVLQISACSEAVSHGRAGLLLHLRRQILRYGEQS